MSFNTPQTLSVKRKRGDAPIDSLLVDQSSRTKRQATERIIFRRIQKVDVSSRPVEPPAQPLTPRRFHFSRGARDYVLIEEKEAAQAATSGGKAPVLDATPENACIPRKLPGASEVEKQFRSHTWGRSVQKPSYATSEPSEDLVRQLQQFAEEVENKEALEVTPVVKKPLKYKPKVPTKRYKERHPEQSEDAMDVDTDDYVYDTYVREIIMHDTAELAPEPQGSVGFIIITDEDEELWEAYGHDDKSDREFDTDDEDENAENYYGADYPEDEVESDDEYGVNLYKYNHGSDEEEYDVDNDAWSDDDVDDLCYPWRREFKQRNDIGEEDD
ncbi:hypothetical protein K469DRAFT_725343 [Zopfia rhizophila CBS 207.26]|uniref:Transcription factor Iwr1 domain-containing protein n=1 Tax=Zopfia rhizophila CBS 207.26 TaxID=1314779 RepID=A0A6A6E5S6_9PEZI|nr:hypothetical protein K469DRAFT_725343 [Zopfia rhizophila CBS 207.26]